MRHTSHTPPHSDHPTLIASVRHAVQAWRKRAGWSRETVTQAIVECYETHGGPAHTGLKFDPETRDAFERTKVNADRVFRWLDDESKDNNLLPPNLLPFVLTALPVDLRIACVDQILRLAGLSVRVIAQDDASLVPAQLVQSMIKESGEATCALAGLMEGVTPSQLAKAQQELTESIAEQSKALAKVECALAAIGHVH